MSLLDLIDEKRPEILRIAAKHGARNLRLFGSVARGDDRATSDVDLLADELASGHKTPLQRELRRLLGVKVDVVTDPHPYVEPFMVQDAVSLEAPDFREQAVLQSLRPHPPVDRDSTYLRLMLDDCEEIETMAMSGRDAFLFDSMVQRAIVMTLILIGENARRVSSAFRKAHPEIPWRKIVGLRNVSVHNYPSLDFVQIWDETIHSSVPLLKTELEKLL